MGKNKPQTPAPTANTIPAPEPVINEADGEPIFHAPEEEGDGDV